MNNSAVLRFVAVADARIATVERERDEAIALLKSAVPGVRYLANYAQNQGLPAENAELWRQWERRVGDFIRKHQQ